MKGVEIEKKIHEYILNSKNIHDYSFEYRFRRAQGLILLFELKSYYNSLKEMKNDFYDVRNKLIKNVELTIIQEEFLDEMEAFLINHYKLDFWESSLDDFKTHKIFKNDFDRL